MHNTPPFLVAAGLLFGPGRFSRPRQVLFALVMLPVMLLCCLAVLGCHRADRLPVYAWETTDQALGFLATQNNGMVTFEADVTVRVIDAGDKAGKGDEVDAGVGRAGDELSMNLYAWQHEKVRIDFSDQYKQQGVAVTATQAARIVGLCTEAWLLFRTGIFRHSPQRLADTGDGLLVWRADLHQTRYTAFTAPDHMVACEYRLTDPADDMPRKSGMALLKIDRFKTRGGIVWPTRLYVQASDGLAIEMLFTNTRINGDLPGGIFDSATGPASASGPALQPGGMK